MHYVVGDVHGCYEQLMEMIDLINTRDEEANFIFVGDFVDRGPEVKKVLDWCIENIKPNGKFQSVLGNHEDMIMDWYENLYLPYNAYKKINPDTTVKLPKTNYDFYFVVLENELDENQIKTYIDWMKTLPCYIDLEIDGKPFRIVHAWSSFKEQYDTKEYYVWYRNTEGNYENDVTIVHGHTPTITDYYTEDSPGKICYRHNSINVDGGCVFGKWFPEYTCHLCAICLETMEEFYVPSK